jgi:hypothetical protein
MENKYKAKLKRRGVQIYNKYFYNPNEVINKILTQYDNKEPINESICNVIIDVPEFYMPQIYELIKYYPNKLREIKYINEQVIRELYKQYGTTIIIMNESKGVKNVRGKICDSANKRAKEKGISFEITNEDIILVRHCPFLNIRLEYGNTKAVRGSASIDRIDSTRGYVKGNIQVISMLANSMKSSASPEDLITFSKSVLKIYGW